MILHTYVACYLLQDPLDVSYVFVHFLVHFLLLVVDGSDLLSQDVHLLLQLGHGHAVSRRRAALLLLLLIIILTSQQLRQVIKLLLWLWKSIPIMSMIIYFLS